MLRTISVLSRLARTTSPSVYSRVLSPVLIDNARSKYQNRGGSADRKGKRKAASYEDFDEDIPEDVKPEYNLLDDK